MKGMVVFFLMFFGFNLFAQNNPHIKPEFDFWQRATVSIGNLGKAKYEGKEYEYYNTLGTGVVTYVMFKHHVVPVLVTAKHVVQSKIGKVIDTIRVRFSWESESSVFKHLGYRIPLFRGDTTSIYMLPDSTIDLVCVPLIFLIDKADISMGGMIPYRVFATSTDYFEGRDVYSIGYPAGVGVEYLTRGILRRGIISWLPSTNIEGKKFLVDCNVYPGNSGGPVFGNHINEILADTITANISTLSAKFYGIVVQRRFNYNELFEVVDNKRVSRPGFLAPESMGVGVVEPASNVLKLLKYTEELINKFWFE